MKYQTIQRCRGVYPVQLMCRCLQVSTSGFHAWSKRSMSRRSQDNQRLLVRIRELHAGSDGVMGMPRMHEELGYEGETASPNRIARLMSSEGLQGVPQRRQWRKKPSSARPAYVRNHLERDFVANEPNTKWVTDITYLRTAECWLYLCVVLDLYSKRVVGWSMSNILSDHYIVSSMSAVGHCGDNAAAEGFFGLLKRERVYRRSYQTMAQARSDVFDYIERHHNLRMQRRLDNRDQQFIALTQQSA